MDSGIDESIEMRSNDVRVDAMSYSWAVDSAIRSSTCSSDLGASPIRSFGSIVDSAIRSDSASDFVASPAHGFASAENVTSTVAARSRQVDVVPNETRHARSLKLAMLNAAIAVFNATGHVAALPLNLATLKAATNNFTLENKIGVGSFGVVYRAKLGGRELAIKRAKTWSNTPSATKTELAFLSRLQHEHLVGLIKFCEEKDEILLVYEYMKNGALFSHLHEKGSSELNSWKMRINIALDASLGIEYLHNNYEGRSVIHGNVNSYNVLLDANWTARVSDFGLTFMKDPGGAVEVLTAKSDVYGLGVVLLELLTGKRPVFTKYGEYGDTTLCVEDFAMPAIMSGNLLKTLDPKVGLPDVNEAEALKLVANTAIQCVNLEARERPIMPNIVVNLKLALAICDRKNQQQELPQFWGILQERNRKKKNRERKIMM